MPENAFYSQGATGQGNGYWPAVPQKKPVFDEVIANIARLRDRHAFVTLFDYFAPRVKAYVMRGGLSEAEAEELAQDTMLQVWQKAGQFDPKRASAATWIYTIARNKKIDRLRKDKFVTIDLDQLSEAGQEIAAESQDPLMSPLMAERLTDAIHALPEEQAVLVKQAFFQDMSHADIASATRIPLGTVKSRLRLGLARLRKILFDNDQDASPF